MRDEGEWGVGGGGGILLDNSCGVGVRVGGILLDNSFLIQIFSFFFRPSFFTHIS